LDDDDDGDSCKSTPKKTTHFYTMTHKNTKI